MRELIAYGSSLLLHGAALAAIHFLATNLPEAWRQRSGRARIDLVASIAATTERRPEDETLIIEREPTPRETPLPDVEAERTVLPRREPTLSPEPPIAPGELPERIQAERHDDPPRRVELQEHAREERPPLPPVKRPPARVRIELASVESAPSPASQADEGTDVDELPRKLPTNPPPRYPAAAMAARQTGVVLLTVTVRPDGTADAVELKTSSGFPLLDEAAIAAVRAWRFDPGRRLGTPVTSRVNVPVRFGFTR
jgi:protein TonB